MTDADRIVHHLDPTPATKWHAVARSHNRPETGPASFNMNTMQPGKTSRYPPRIVVKPGREIIVRVTDSNQAPGGRRGGSK